MDYTEIMDYIEKISKKIVLIDGNQLAHYMIENNIKSSTKFYKSNYTDQIILHLE
ncbi:MAG: hypothetical protein ACFFAN_05550 [Promethearchaeota archaeon]